MPRKNRAVKAKSEHQSISPTEPEPEAQLRESQMSTQSQSCFNEEDLGPEVQLRESQMSTRSCSDTDAAGPESEIGSLAALIKESHDYFKNQEETLSTCVSTQEAKSPTKDDDVEAEAESARASSDEDTQNHGRRQEEPLATGIQTSRTGAQMELNVEDDPLHMSSDEVSRNPFQDPPMHLSQNQHIQSGESDPDDLDKGGKPAWFAENKLYWKTVHESTHLVADPTMSPPDKSDPEPALPNLHSNTEKRPESTKSASSSPAPQYQKVHTTEMVRSETTRIIRSFQQEKIRIETALKSDSDLSTLREREEKLEDHETILSNLIDELMIELKKTRGELKRISRRYGKALADFEKASD
ncbi:uncharacterized protein Bfra_001538 [Botrytis fragariae]|uniref:Uncharacterized protein n=1 Tax=Botrytis fragariae TaxID=1964551 RepID=A0A8H6B135_9HELO|nr:uncharacterized protein Bfra_001538 [Botrytis fragariae]KAF5877175.1 hypothetical protein Bfra_001538 [Botrytis fragariae]